MKREKSPNQVMPAFTKKPVKVVKPIEEPVPEIDTAKAVAFAMSIAMEMKQRQRAEDDARKQEEEVVYEKRNVKYSQKDLDTFKTKLMSARDAASSYSTMTQGTARLCHLTP